MKCPYCDTTYTSLPANRRCASCGAVLPEVAAGVRYCSGCGTACPEDGNFCVKCGQDLRGNVSAPATQIHITMNAPGYVAPGGLQCPRCGSYGVTARRRGYSWGLGILGFFLFPIFGLLLGTVGSRKTRCACPSCRFQWKLK